ncbi:DNA-binding transcriptional regulator, MarR family [Methylomagnum ishizawai]|uniref:DNA-binding transcriptional regulator, MarR family n=1 Tax=Methylomagnum ishizawai TaxID=1760988 RepID=A0A1Y6CWN1_9GAMM|nr:MarR family transcriptional regulator [Methylomagnum ishizawai]SMF95079.1 DNA-binding transcriptional regulator, MarR family [Methylomagnum ishizawai]
MHLPAIFPPVLRELIRTHQTFLSYAAKHAGTLGLTLPQLDVILALGGTPGMPHKALGEKTLITKGTLSGVVGRLEDKGLVERTPSPKDGRSQIVRLTQAGHALWERGFPEHLDYLEQLFQDYAAADIALLHAALTKLRQAVNAATLATDGLPGQPEAGSGFDAEDLDPLGESPAPDWP